MASIAAAHALWALSLAALAGAGPSFDDDLSACLALDTAALQVSAGAEDADDDADADSDAEGLLSGYQARARDIGLIKVVTVETRAGDPMKLPGRNAGTGDTSMVKNVGAGEKWHYYRTKNGLMLKWINETIERNPDQLAIMIDGGDMVFGGCDEAFLMRKYTATLEASGGGPNMTVVMSAETGCYPKDMGKMFRKSADLEARRARVAHEVSNLTADWVKDHAPCTDRRVAPCDASPAYRYPNWGWVMGPVKSLKPLFEFVYHDGRRGELDQERAEWWVMAHQDHITLDYAGSMVLSTHQMVHGRPESEAPVQIRVNDKGEPWIANRITGEPCCFLHGNGNGEGFVNKMMKEMASRS